MAEYTLYFTQTATSRVTVEAGNLDAAITKAYDEVPNDVCAHCAGWGGKVGIDLSGDWELDAKSAYDDYPEGGE